LSHACDQALAANAQLPTGVAAATARRWSANGAPLLVLSEVGHNL